MRRPALCLAGAAALHALAGATLHAQSSCGATAAADPPTVVATDRGAVRGVPEGGVVAFRGVPYAAPPVDSLRWRAPRPSACWTGVRDVRDFGPPCPQRAGILRSTEPVLGSEDCLTLNVWTPADRRRGERLPVLVFLHGGGNTAGAPSAETFGARIYDGGRLAARGRVVVVTPQYRLGYLGFLAHPALDAESPDGTSGNYGLLDQIAALRWVRRNVEAFGGDGTRVLLFGQSAGGKDVCALLAAPGARGLFARAAVLSGSCEAVPPLASMEAHGRRWAAAVGCPDGAQAAACLRAKPADDLTRVALPTAWIQEDFQLGPTVDGHALPLPPGSALRRRAAPTVPLLVGNAEDEFAYSLLPGVWREPIRTAADYERAVRATLGDSLASPVLARYPATRTTPRDAFVRVLSDAMLVCPTRRLARAAAAAGAPVWRYLWTHTTASGPAHEVGPAHVTDVPFWLGTLPDSLRTPSERRLTDAMTRHLVSFAATGDPNYAGGARWPRYDQRTDPYLRLDDATTARTGVHRAQCDFWDRARPMASAPPRLVVPHDTAPFDESPILRADGPPPNARATLRAPAIAVEGLAWSGDATFAAGARAGRDAWARIRRSLDTALSTAEGLR